MDDFQPNGYKTESATAGAPSSTLEIPVFHAYNAKSLIQSVELGQAVFSGTPIRSSQSVLQVKLRPQIDAELTRKKLLGDMIKQGVRAFIDYEENKEHHITAIVLRCPYPNDESRNNLISRFSEFISDESYGRYQEFMSRLGVPSSQYPSRELDFHI